MKITTYFVEAYSKHTRKWVKVPETYGNLEFAQEAMNKLRAQGFRTRIRVTRSIYHIK